MIDLKTLRGIRNITQVEVAKRMGITQCSVSVLENSGILRMQVSTLKRFVEACDHDLRLHVSAPPGPFAGEADLSLREIESQDKVHPTVGQDDGTDMLKARVEVMRSLGVTKWGDIELGPEPAKPTSPEDATQRSQQSEAEQKAREQRLKFGASGGPRLRGGST